MSDACSHGCLPRKVGRKTHQNQRMSSSRGAWHDRRVLQKRTILSTNKSDELYERWSHRYRAKCSSVQTGRDFRNPDSKVFRRSCCSSSSHHRCARSAHQSYTRNRRPPCASRCKAARDARRQAVLLRSAVQSPRTSLYELRFAHGLCHRVCELRTFRH